VKRLHLRTAVLALCFATACGPDYGDAFERSFHAAQRAQNAGRYEEAADLYRRAVGDAQRIKDRDEAYFMRARMFERLERWDDARGVYRELLRRSPNGPRAGRAAYEHATLLIEHGDADEGWRELRAAISSYPKHGSVRQGMRRWIEHEGETAGEEAVRKQLHAWLDALAGTEVEQQLKYEMGLSYERSRALAEAHTWLLRAAREHPYPVGNLTDDALWRAAEVAEAMDRPREAIDNLRELLGVREVTQYGSYERPRFAQAQMRIAELYRDRIGDDEAARREFRKTYLNHATSALADDAFWQEAVLAHHVGDREAACALARELHERFPGSRYEKCTREICPSAPKPPRPCPPYLRATLDQKPAR
jgi:tetratricopeptide (TPR) repeat protein